MIGHTFDYDKIHKALKIVADLPKIGVPPAGLGEAAAAAEADAPAGGAAVGGASPLPRGSHSRSTSRHGSHPSPIHRFFSSIFGMCRDIQIRQKDTQTLKQIATRLELDPPRSPLSEPETEE